VTLSNATDGARLKVWPGSETDFQPGLGGGGGSGYVRNVTYDTFGNINNDGAIKIDQCYGEKNATRCEEFPSKMNITDVLFKNFYGTTSKSNDPIVGSLICSTETVSGFRSEPPQPFGDFWILILVSRVTTFGQKTSPSLHRAGSQLSGSAGIWTRVYSTFLAWVVLQAEFRGNTSVLHANGP
jgi:hypothetical protein